MVKSKVMAARIDLRIIRTPEKKDKKDVKLLDDDLMRKKERDQLRGLRTSE